MGIPICTHIIPHNEYIPFLYFIFLIWILFLSFFGKNNKNYKTALWTYTPLLHFRCMRHPPWDISSYIICTSLYVET